MENKTPKVIISALLEKTANGQKKVYVQTRWKPDRSPQYSGMIEIPAGAVEDYENVFDALRREVKEETGLNIVSVKNCAVEEAEIRKGDKNQIFTPFVCQQTLSSRGGLPWIGFVFVCEVDGVVKIAEDEAKDPQWLTVGELKTLLQEKPETIFPLQYPVLKYYLSKQ